jgi:outer membrane protein OmpA-like peptidoglycan-associated protein
MKKTVFILIAFIAVLTPSVSFSYTLSWQIKEGERIEVVKTAAVKLYINSMEVRRYRERNIADLSCYAKKDFDANVKGTFAIFHSDNGSDIFRLEARMFSDFVISSDGKMSVPSEFTMPNLRHIPYFPSKDIGVNDTWTYEAELIFTHLSKPLVMGLPVTYKLERIEKKDGHRLALISYSWTARRSLAGMNFPDDFPLMITGKDKGLIWWDIDTGRPADSSNDYRIIFLQPDGCTTVEFQMGINSENKVYSAVTPEAGEKAREELEKDLKGKDGISVASDPRGLAVRMGEVLFDFDSASLKKDTKSTLDLLIAAVKKKYPDREIIVEGHTDSTGEKKYNQALSDKRAETVARYLSTGVGHDKFSYRGYGADKPIADNAAEEGRKKNRRVEIIIKLN